MAPDTQDYKSFTEAKQDVTDYIIGYYYEVRPHHYNAGLSSNESERRFWEDSKAAAKFS